MKEFKALGELLEKGYPISDSLLVIHPRFKEIVYELEQGKTFEDIIIKEGRGSFYEHCRFFLSISPLSSAIQSALVLVDFKKQLKAKWIKETAYPIFVLLFSFVTLFIFSHLILPTMVNSFSQINEKQFLFQFINFLQYFVYFLLIVGIVILCFVLCFFFIEPFQCKVYESFLAQFTLSKEIFSYFIATYMVELIGRGCSTKEMMNCLLRMHQMPYMREIIHSLVHQLESGEDLAMMIQNQKHFQRQFKFFFSIGIYTQNLSSALRDYKEFQENAWMKKLKTASVLIQVSAYSFIGIMIVLIYQMMLLPLELLNTF